MVDDDRAEHTIFSRAFGKNDVSVESYFSAESAVDALFSGKRPRLVLLDIRMPGMGGFFFLQQRLTAGLLQVPVVMLSSSSNADDISEAYKYGAAAYLQKPCDYASLRRFTQLVTDFWFELVKLPESC
ncbi:MAG: response regulator [Myxococcota bacterium]